jgi:hypothetical protein
MNSIRNRNRELPEIPGSLPLLLNEHQAAALLGVSVSYLRKSRCQGKIGKRTPGPKFVRVGGKIMYPRTNLNEWVSSLALLEVI